jgi:hypothetical protein
MREIKYNSQIDNKTMNGLNGYSQCFSTSNFMRMSYYCDGIHADDDAGLAEFVKQMETVIGPKIEHVPHPSLYFDVQAAMVTKTLNLMMIPGKDVFESGITMSRLYKLLIDGPVTIGTNKFGGLPGGHIILAVDHDVFNDPFGDANTGYSSKNGKAVIYKPEFIKHYFTGNVLYWSNK